MERFMELVREYDGFEFIQAYRDDVDHLLGGKGNVYWYTIMKEGKVKESYIGQFDGAAWKDIRVKGSGKRRKTEEIKPGTTIARIVKFAYLAQDEKWVKDRKGRLIEDGHPHYHYTYGFGDKALDVSEKYGVSIGYSDLKDVPAGFHLRYLYTGADVEQPDF